MMNNKCLYCYEKLEKSNKGDFHAHCSLEFFGTDKVPQLPYSFAQMAELAKNVVERSVAVPGVQPKLSLSLVNEIIGKTKSERLTVVGALGGNYIFKPPSVEYSEMPQNEHVTMRIAEAYGIRTVQSSLIRLQSGELSYITKRIDRTAKGDKIHMIDMFQVLEAVDKYKSSMEKIGKALGDYSTNPLLDKLYFFELSVLSFLTGNNDMHLKNFSMINNDKDWGLSTAYDLLNVSIVNPKDTEELAITLEGKKKKLKLEHFESLGKGLGLNEKQISGVFKRFIKNKSIANDWISNSFLSIDNQKKYKSLLKDRYSRLAE